LPKFEVASVRPSTADRTRTRDRVAVSVLRSLCSIESS
jgi:hypothetical protein